MDLSGLIFVALAVAWAAYLIPKALRHHDDVSRGRSVEGFSERLRVLARREPVSARDARLVVPGARPAAAAPASTARAARRRRRVLSALVVLLLGVVAVCATGRVGWASVAVPVVLLAGWLVACRLMVRREHAVARPVVPAAEPEAPEAESPVDAEHVTAAHEPVDPDTPGLWDPVPVTLPTYVSKPPARRSVRTIDLDSTGVWTSGRTQADSALAREADAERARRRTSDKQSPGEAVGS